MKLTIHIEDNNFQAFLNFLKTLDYVKVLKKEEVGEASTANNPTPLAGSLSKEGAELLVKHGKEIREEWDRGY